MESYLRSFDPLLLGMVGLPLVLAGAAWALRMACAICSVRVPDFVPAATVVIVILVTNFGLRILLNHNHLVLGLGSQLLLVLLTSALVISFSVRTTIASALAVTITQVFLCVLMVFGLSRVSDAML